MTNSPKTRTTGMWNQELSSRIEVFAVSSMGKRGRLPHPVPIVNGGAVLAPSGR